MSESLDIPGLSDIAMSTLGMRHENAKSSRLTYKSGDIRNLNPMCHGYNRLV